MIKYILQGIGMLVMPRRENATKNLHLKAAVEAKVLAAKTMERVWIDEATAWAKKTLMDIELAKLQKQERLLRL